MLCTIGGPYRTERVVNTERQAAAATGELAVHLQGRCSNSFSGTGNGDDN